MRPSEQLVTAAVLAGSVYTLIAVHYKESNSFFPVTLIAVLVAFLFRVFAVRKSCRNYPEMQVNAIGELSVTSLMSLLWLWICPSCTKALMRRAARSLMSSMEK